MPSAPTRRLHVAADAPSSASSPEQQAFDTLNRRIGEQRALLAEWRTAIDAYEQRYVRDLLPLLTEYRGLYVALLERLDHAAAGGLRLGRTDAQALHALIVDIATSLLRGEHDAALRDQLKGLCDKYGDAPVAATPPRGKAAATAAPGEPETAHDDWEADQARAEAERERQRAQHRRDAAARKKQREPEAAEASQSLRAVYRQLVSALHPDREPDTAERARKTALMQKVNEAYAAQRLADLLHLQQDLMLSDARAASSQPADRLAAYNRLLTEQLAALQRELRETEAEFKARHHLNPHGRLRPATLADHLRLEMSKLANGIREMQREARMLDDPETLKQWVKAQRKLSAY